MNKKSQAALEYLTTYAWAFIVIATTISALYYFGILDFGKFLPQKCTFPSQFKCLDFSLNPSQVKVKLVNSLGEDVNVTSLQITNDASPPISCTPTVTPLNWVHADEQEFIFTSCSGGAYIPGSRIDLKVLFTYFAVNTPSKPIHTVNGKINGKVTSS